MANKNEGPSIQVNTRFKRDVHALMKRDAGPLRGVPTVNKYIVEEYYKKELAQIRKNRNPKS